MTAFVDRTGLPALVSLGVSDNIVTGETETWTDWDGSVVGSGPMRESFRATAARFATRPDLTVR